MKWIDVWMNAFSKPEDQPRTSPREAPSNAYDLFDRVARALASPLPRRQLLKLALVGLATTALTSLGVKPAWAGSDCTCNGAPILPDQACCDTVTPNQPYDPLLHCCTEAGLQPLYPIADLNACPDRVAYLPHVPAVHICASLKVPASFGLAHFSACCEAHDRCYDTCYSITERTGKSQKECDGDFGNCLLAQCQQVYGDNKRLVTQCEALASRYYDAALKAGGTKAYAFLQRQACQCCAGDVPCCPTDEGWTLCASACCPPSYVCSAPGVCTCPEGQTDCNGVCVDLNNDNNHCGNCGNRCPNQQVCQNGTCVCPYGLPYCDGQCCDGLDGCCDNGKCCRGVDVCCGDGCCDYTQLCCGGQCCGQYDNDCCNGSCCSGYCCDEGCC